jgi:hypothetical protein
VDWLHHYKALLEQWSEERLQKEAAKAENGGWLLPQQSPREVNKFVSPDTKLPSYLISAAKTKPTTTTWPTTEAMSSMATSTASRGRPVSIRTRRTTTTRPTTLRSASSIVYEAAPKTTTPTTTTTTQEASSSRPSTTTKLIFNTVKNAMAASNIENEVAQPKEEDNAGGGISGLISPNMAKG